MSTTSQLATGLGGAIGSDYRRTHNQLFFVEYNGKISRLDLVRALEKVVFSGVVLMPADSSIDLQDGTSVHGGHIRWDHTSPTKAAVMRPQASCRLSYLGQVNFDAITHAELQNLPYSQADIPGSQLKNMDVFGVYNTSVQPASNFDYAKVQVLSTGAAIQVRWVTYGLRPRYQVLGTGYTNPEDIRLTSDERFAYVTERSGNLLQVDLSNANRAAAKVICSGLNAPQQIFLDEARSQAYTVEFTNPGRLIRVDLGSGAKAVLASNLEFPIGILLSDDLGTAYVSEQAGRVVRITLSTGQREVLVQGLTNPFFLTWFDSARSAILVSLRDPANQVMMLNLTQAPVSTTLAAGGLPPGPSSVAIMSPGRALVCCNTEIVRVDLTGGIFSPAGPLFLGIGHVPSDHIVNGYADTTRNPVTHAPENYFFRVRDSPFGGTLALMFNHDKARDLGARYYQIQVDSRPPETHAWSDYRWNGVLGSFELVPCPQVGSLFQVRKAGEIWYNYWLGYFLDTTTLTDAPHTIHVRIYNSVGTEIGHDSRLVQTDNQWPRAVIEKILYHDPSNPVPAEQHREIPACGIASGTSDEFSFLIEATDPVSQHLLSWSISVMWGDNRSLSIAQDSYEPGHVSPTCKWAGVHGEVPASHWHAMVPGDETSKKCAHTFYLGVWDRVINGWGYLHYASYHKSITILIK
jgi:hypothetical protein